jgi:hypothetical protein
MIQALRIDLNGLSHLWIIKILWVAFRNRIFNQEISKMINLIKIVNSMIITMIHRL